MLADIQKFLAEQDFSSSDWQIFYAGLLVASLLWLGKSIWQRITHKPPVFEGDIYDLRFPATDNGAIVGRETELADLAQAWRSPDIRVLALVAWAGVGKTALVNVWREVIKFSEEETLSPKRIYAWSFQNQGIANTQTSSGAFFDHALSWFKSDRDKFGSEHDKGAYLAKLINTQRTLLILDGLEVFHPYSTAELQGQLNDPALLGLLQTLAKDNAGLCLLTTRQALGEHLTRYQGVRNRPLENLAIAAAVQLLQRAGVKGKAQELEVVATEYHGHAYSLTLLANYLRQYAKGDIRRRDTLPTLTDETRAEGWQAQQLLWAYANALEDREDLGLLYITSVFDQAVEHGLILELIRALKKGGYQTALNRLNLTRLDELQRWAACCGRLRKQGLLLGNSDEWLDLHPLVRDFFRREFAQWQGGIKKIIHLELYAYYKALPEKELPDTLEEMQPLFSAVAHGCLAKKPREVLKLYLDRIQRNKEAFLTHKLGLLSDDVALLANFFPSPWNTVNSELVSSELPVLLNWTGFSLCSLGRFSEAKELLHSSIKIAKQHLNWSVFSSSTHTLSEILLLEGKLAEAEEIAVQAESLADKHLDEFEQLGYRATYGYILFLSGKHEAAAHKFNEAEKIQKNWQPKLAALYSEQGYRAFEFLLVYGDKESVIGRATYLNVVAQKALRGRVLDYALAKLAVAKAQMELIDFDVSINLLRKAGQQQYLPLGLLARAALHRHTRDFARARADLQEVFDIADGSGMLLHLTDYHLEMARVLLAEEQGDECIHHLTAAERLINETGYHRRDKELAELKQHSAQLTDSIKGLVILNKFSTT